MKTVEKKVYILRPTEEQIELIFRNCNNARFAYNWGVAKIRDALDKHEKFPTGYQLAKEFNEFKHQPGYEWLIDNNASQRATKYAFTKQLFKGINKFIKKQRRAPTFHSKRRAKMSYFVDDENTRFGSDYVVLEGLGKVKCYNDFSYTNSKIADPSIVYTGDRFELYVTIVHEQPEKPEYHFTEVDHHNSPIGIDVGITHAAVTSNGDVYDTPINTKLWKKIARIDRRISKWHKNFAPKVSTEGSCDAKTKLRGYKSQNVLKLESMRRRLYRKDSQIRKDFRCKTVSAIVSKYPSAIVIEDIKNPFAQWSIKGAKAYNKRINNAAIGDLLSRIRKKCEWLDIPLIIADPFYPSTKKCSCCGNEIDNKITRNRRFHCSVCGFEEDRDLNAAINLRNLA